MTDPTAALVPLALPTGGWGYWTGQPIHFEPTCLAVLALRSAGDSQHQLIDSAVPGAGRPGDGVRAVPARPRAAGGHLADVAGRRHAGGARADRCRRAVGQEAAGRPRADDQGGPRSPEHVRHRPAAGRLAVGRGDVRLGRADRLGRAWPCGPPARGRTRGSSKASSCCSTGRSTRGGINYGNRQVLGSMTEPIPGPTAVMLLALQGHDEPRVTAARRLPGAGRRRHDRPGTPRLGQAGARRATPTTRRSPTSCRSSTSRSAPPTRGRRPTAARSASRDTR